MKNLLEDILEIPARLQDCYAQNQNIKLPEGVPYLGMGASYNAALTLLGCGKRIDPQIASEYYHYTERKEQPLGVFISQSGETSEILWNLERFQKVIAITNQPESMVATSPKTQQVIEMRAGAEDFAATKTYLNTLLILYLGLGINPQEGMKAIERNLNHLQKAVKKETEKASAYIKPISIKGLSVLGSGPNRGTALEGALTLSETTKRSWCGMSPAEYDHGPKETANDSVVLLLNANGKDAERLMKIKKILKTKSNAHIVELTESQLPEEISPLSLTVQLNFFAYYFAELTGIEQSFHIGEKITRVL